MVPYSQRLVSATLYIINLVGSIFQIHALDRNSEELKAEAASDWDFILTKMLDLVRPDQDGAVPPLYTLEVRFGCFSTEPNSLSPVRL